MNPYLKRKKKIMNFKEILATAIGVALGVVLAGIISTQIAKMGKDNFENPNA